MTYSYLCKHCNKEFEKEQKITAKVGAICPTCGNRSSNRLITCTNFVLKDGGCGWFKSGYAGHSSSKKV